MTCWSLRVDWSALGDMLSGTGGMIAGGAGVAVAIFAYQGLHVWKKQLTGTRDIQLIDEILTGAYEAEEAFRYMTGPFSTTAEHEQVPKLADESDADWRDRAAYGVAQVRYTERAESFNKLRAVAFRAKAVLGPEVFENLSDILHLPRMHVNLGGMAYRYQARVRQLHRDMELGITISEEDFDSAVKVNEAAQAAFWGFDEDKSPGKAMESRVKDLERLLTAHQAA